MYCASFYNFDTSSKSYPACFQCPTQDNILIVCNRRCTASSTVFLICFSGSAFLRPLDLQDNDANVLMQKLLFGRINIALTPGGITITNAHLKAHCNSGTCVLY